VELAACCLVMALWERANSEGGVPATQAALLLPCMSEGGPAPADKGRITHRQPKGEFNRCEELLMKQRSACLLPLPNGLGPLPRPAEGSAQRSAHVSQAAVQPQHWHGAQREADADQGGCAALVAQVALETMRTRNGVAGSSGGRGVGKARQALTASNGVV
jgi:hypothetical protein